MNPDRITLMVTRGSLAGKEFVFEQPTECVVGRAKDCDVAFPQDWVNMNVSRHHCAFEIDPPTIWVRDLKSHNGTFVNGDNIAHAPAAAEPPAWELSDGDEVKVGNNVFRVAIGADKTNFGVVPLYFL